MKSDETTKSAGYTAVFGFNLRQLMRYLTGEVCLETGNLDDIAANHANIGEKTAMEVA